MFTISDRVSKNGGVMDKIIGVAIGSYGVGGLFLGFRESGVRGALLGGATGFAGFYATYYTAIFFAGFFGITATPASDPSCLMALAGHCRLLLLQTLPFDKILVKERIR